jgi:hypothetical protein
MFDPLTRDEATVHRHKAGLFDAIAPGLHAVMAMDASIERYLRSISRRLPFSGCPTWWRANTCAHRFPKRKEAAASSCWAATRRGGAKPRNTFLAGRAPECRVHLERPVGRGARCLPRRRAHQPERSCRCRAHYFDQFRAFETWAAGTAVVSDISKAGKISASSPACTWPWPISRTCRWACAELLADVPRREAMVRASQQLLRERFLRRHGKAACWP